MKVQQRKKSLGYPRILIWEQYGTIGVQRLPKGKILVLEGGRSDCFLGSEVAPDNFTEFKGELVFSND